VLVKWRYWGRVVPQGEVMRKPKKDHSNVQSIILVYHPTLMPDLITRIAEGSVTYYSVGDRRIEEQFEMGSPN